MSSGQAVPNRRNLRALAPSGDHRLLGGIGFMDRLLGELGLREGPLVGELLLQIAGLVLRHHAGALADFRGTVPDGRGERSWGFEEYAGFGEYLLLHPGFTDLQERMPDALWRVHIHVLQRGQLFALAQAHLRFSTPQIEQGLLNFLEQAERRSAPLRFPT